MKNVVNFTHDFYVVPSLKFDVEKLRSDLEKVLKRKILVH